MAHAAHSGQVRPATRTSFIGALLAAYEWLSAYWERSGNADDSELPDHIRRIIDNRNFYI